ncbi:alpha/beta hydrolase [Amycolatopsis rhabdoformis]|uniref:Alpha/beta hydrolase n=1 Tax=Amycolatopsis rhabdoformis TaxID=1448059 RepID=A0ABZ1IHD8_9PSEU|nr:alpha/beta hydrolase [Amycolatopsis rhabdoformis]WSE33885.1 alpha/beta hydrolase [Amycolatopsis rhabdoformis]
MTDYILVHGAWCTGRVWDTVAAGLTDLGHTVHVVEQLPSTGGAGAGLAEDVEHVRQALRARPGAVLVAHSYAGIVAAELADEPDLAHTVHLASFWPRPGQALVDLRAEWDDPWLDDGGDGTLVVTDRVDHAHSMLAADLSDEDYAVFHATLRPQSLASVVTPASAPKRTHPATYVRCLRDQAVPTVDQVKMGAGADHTVTLDASHMVMLSRPRELVAVLAKVGENAKQPA